ncbi:MAG: hypothetical protein ABR980_11710 [Ignavibacteriaceae bacterium]
MNQFSRGIKNQEFINALNVLYNKEGSFWNKMVHDKDLFIAIRDDYINVYYNGNSICKLYFKDSKIIGKTHYKYLLLPKLKKEYIESSDGIFQIEKPTEMFIPSLNDLKLIKKSSLVYSTVEKQGVHLILIKKKNVIDVEIAFPKLDRIDYLKLKEINKSLQLVFYEAKHFTNHELRSTKDKPDVLRQILKYGTALRDHESEIIQSYKTVCKNLQELNLIKPHNDNYIKRVSDGENISIDYAPKLLIFGFDQDQKGGSVWEKHRKKLEAELEGGRLRLIGKVN